MKRFLIVIVIISLIGFILLYLAKEKVSRDLAQPVMERILTPTPTMIIDKNTQVETSVFVPYWALDEQAIFPNTYDVYIYFGIAPTMTGIQGNESGAAQVGQFTASVPAGKEKWLTLRMVDGQTNAEILKSKAAQAAIIAQTVAFAKQHEFSGVVLDLEMNAIPFDSLIDQITAFTKTLSEKTKQEQMTFHMTIYGDAFYRPRPFAIKELAKHSDSMLFMAYDFHKSRGNPGPNFPWGGRETYGYDMEEMVIDALQGVPQKKVSVVFGYFGYDWVVDAQGKALASGKPLTYLAIQQKFLNACSYSDCQVKRDPTSLESFVTYTDDQKKKHIVWFEDPQSVAAKQKLLQQRGISNFSFWAYSYF